MEPKYKKGQKVQIISIRDKDGNDKHVHNKKYVNEKGVILDAFYLGHFHVLYYKDHLPEASYIYKVRLGNSNIVVTVAEEEIAPCNYLFL